MMDAVDTRPEFERARASKQTGPAGGSGRRPRGVRPASTRLPLTALATARGVRVRDGPSTDPDGETDDRLVAPGEDPDWAAKRARGSDADAVAIAVPVDTDGQLPAIPAGVAVVRVDP